MNKNNHMGWSNKTYFDDLQKPKPIYEVEKAIKKPDMLAYCTSMLCDKGMDRTRGRGVVKDNAVRGNVDCPDCSHALYWERERDE